MNALLRDTLGDNKQLAESVRRISVKSELRARLSRLKSRPNDRLGIIQNTNGTNQTNCYSCHSVAIANADKKRRVSPFSIFGVVPTTSDRE